MKYINNALALFSNIDLGKKLFALPMIVSAFLLLVSAATLYRLFDVGNDVEDITGKMVPETKAATGLLQNVLQKDKIVQEYLRTNDERLVTRFNELEQEYQVIVQRAEVLIDDSDQKQQLEHLVNLGQEYNAVFTNEVIENTRTQIRITEELLNEKGPLVAESLSNIIDAASTANADGIVVLASEALMNFHQAEACVLRYLFDNGAYNIDDFNEKFTKTRLSLNHMKRIIKNRKRSQWAQTGSSTLSDYASEFSNIVTAITSRNNAVKDKLNVVSAQIAKASHTLEGVVWQQLDDVMFETERNITQTSVTVIGATALAIFLGLFLATFVSRGVLRRVKDAVQVSDNIAKGNLTKKINTVSNDELGQLLRSLARMTDNLCRIVQDVRTNANSVATNSNHISDDISHLHKRTESQAASLEETAASMEEMAASVKQNAEYAKEASDLATNARDQAKKGDEVVSRAINAMGSINTASKKMSDIISVIDSIAFQTNLLALNAAVEAARAGSEGKGFSVVAAEVRNLAQRSAVASKEIKELINDSVSKINEGSALVNDSGKVLGEIIENVTKVSTIVSEMATANQEQSSSIDQVSKAVTQLDSITQDNANLVRDSNDATKDMSVQADELNRLVDFFVVPSSSGAANSSSGNDPVSIISKLKSAVGSS